MRAYRRRLAVAINVTAAEAAHSGFVTVWPSGSPRPDTSSLNLSAAGQTRPNLVIVALSPGGALSFYSSNGSHLIADVSGYFLAAVSSAGWRLIGLPPSRLLYT